MSKHEVLTGVSYSTKTGTVRLTSGDTFDSAVVSQKTLAFFLARGAIGPAKGAAKNQPATKPAAEAKPKADTAEDWDGSQAEEMA